MPATKRRRTTRRRDTAAPGNDSWQIIGPDGEVLRDLKYGEGATLSVAINLAHRHMPEEKELELIVRLKAVFGEPDNLFRVVREEDGSVNTYRV